MNNSLSISSFIPVNNKSLIKFIDFPKRNRIFGIAGVALFFLSFAWRLHRTIGLNSAYKVLVGARSRLAALNVLVVVILGVKPEHALLRAARFGDVSLVQALGQIPSIDINAASPITHSTPLHQAAANGHVEVIHILNELGGLEVNAKDFFSKTALHDAALHGQAEAIKALATLNGFNVNAVDGHYRTPLHDAALAWNPGAIHALRDVNVDVNALDSEGKTALDLVSERNHTEAIELLL